jgi:hypothetical protein
MLPFSNFNNAKFIWLVDDVIGLCSKYRLSRITLIVSLSLVIARHGLGRFVNVNRCALLGHPFAHKLNSSCNLWGSVYVPTKFEENPFKHERELNHTLARTRTLAHARTQ